MIILKKLFSDKKKEEKKDNSDLLKPIAVGEGIYIADNVVRKKLHNKVLDKLDQNKYETLMHPEDDTLFERLKEEVKKQGTKFQTPEEHAQEVKDKFLKRTDGADPEVKEKLGNKLHDLSLKRMYKNSPAYLETKDTIIMTGKKGDYYNDLENTAATLSHELGHSKHFHGRDGGKIAKIAHKVPEKVTTIGSVSGGFLSGYNAEKKKEKGEKVSTLNKLTPALITAGTYAPVLIAEAAASKRGIKELKKLGASESYLKAARKENNAALGTYVTGGALKNLSLGYGSREAGKLARKLERKKKDKK